MPGYQHVGHPFLAAKSNLDVTFCSVCQLTASPLATPQLSTLLHPVCETTPARTHVFLHAVPFLFSFSSSTVATLYFDLELSPSHAPYQLFPTSKLPLESSCMADLQPHQQCQRKASPFARSIKTAPIELHYCQLERHVSLAITMFSLRLHMAIKSHKRREIGGGKRITKEE